METGSTQTIELNDTVELQQEEMEIRDATEEELNSIQDEMERAKGDAPVVEEEIGSVERQTSVDTLKKAAYYVVFGPKDHKSSSVGDAIKSVHMARFESKAELKKVINSLDENGFKLIDILRGRPLSFEIQVKKVSEIKIGG